MATEMVTAYGDHGLEAVPAEDAVEVQAFPVGPANTVIPASIRFLRKPGEGMPTRLRRVLKPHTRLNKTPFVRVEFDCTPFPRYTTAAGAVMGDWTCCGLRGRGDALDPLWAQLPERERARLLAAVKDGPA